MTATLRFAQSEADHEAIFRLRYEIYVEEMGYAFPGVDHGDRRLAEPVTRPTRLLMAEEAGALVGTLQFNWGSDAPSRVTNTGSTASPTSLPRWAMRP